MPVEEPVDEIRDRGVVEAAVDQDDERVGRVAAGNEEVEAEVAALPAGVPQVAVGVAVDGIVCIPTTSDAE